MKSAGLVEISKKEFRDHIMSKKFLIILAIILTATIVGMIGGAFDYNKQIQNYAEHQVEAQENGHSSYSYMWSKPSVMTIFSQIGTIIASLGAILGIAMGFDLITREKESKSLKILLSHPIYRDEVINGKAVGGVAALILALIVTFVVCVALLMIFSIIPGVSEIEYIMIFGIAAFLMIFSYFAISLFMSTVSENSGSALIYTLIIFIFLTGLLPVLVSGSVMDLLAGDAPQPPESLFKTSSTGALSSVTYAVSSDGDDEYYENPYETDEWQNYENKINEYWQKRQAISDFFNLLSPTNNFQYISSYIAYPQIYRNMYDISFNVEDDSSIPETVDVADVMGDLAKNFIALIAFPAVFFGLAYVRFMRMDIR
ncbi:ABC-2 type transport system permease protein [Methanomicrobium sp. W14]|uniref:ABC transporter permease n=1 Tax=Methanomicrobium sp. W14 TaxID=2817839 RepID=UPI001AE0F31D|nr:ABC transporter permease subunit [Methanomicrobium sp. W14]MBP2134142.1 ABC-2 type transport system permease protein [Methanomicrobium sp. W14]